MLYQRSGDIGLGVPFNMASYAMLTHIIAECCGIKAGILKHIIGDAHIYENHITALESQLEMEPIQCIPRLVLTEDINGKNPWDIEERHLRVDD